MVQERFPNDVCIHIHMLLVGFRFNAIGHINEYPTMHYFGISRHTQSMIAYKIIKSISVNSSEKCIVGMLLTYPFISFHEIQNNQNKKNLQINKFCS